MVALPPKRRHLNPDPVVAVKEDPCRTFVDMAKASYTVLSEDHYKIGYNMNFPRQISCMIVYLILVANVAFLLHDGESGVGSLTERRYFLNLFQTVGARPAIDVYGRVHRGSI